MTLKVGDTFKTPVLGKGLTEHKVITLANYSSGKPHGGIDIGACPVGTEVRAPFDGTVVALSDGVPNNKPNERIYPGKPSNWILLLVRMRTTLGTTRDATLFFQHLSPGLKVKLGQKVKAGDLLGLTGNSGNTTGPHLHLGGQWVQDNVGHGAATRYDHVNSPTLRIWPPERYLALDALPKKVTNMATVQTFKVGSMYKTPLTKPVKVKGSKEGFVAARTTLKESGIYLLTFQVRMPKDAKVTGEMEFSRVGWGAEGQTTDETGHNFIPAATSVFGVWHRWRTFNHEISFNASEYPKGGPVDCRIYLPAGTYDMRFVCKAVKIA